MSSVSTSPNRLKLPRLWVALVLVLLLVGAFVWIRQQEQSAGEKKGMRDLKNTPVPVTLAPVTLQTMPVQIQTIGTVEPISTVILKPQIEGRLTGIHFQEGAFVEQGQLLFSIDTQPVEASLAQAQAVVSKDQSLVAQAQANLVRDQSAVKQAQANIDRDVAQLEYALAQEKRFASLLKDEFISQDQYEQAVTSRRAAEATVISDRSALDNAKAIVEADRSSIESARANVRADQALVDSNRIKLAYGTIRAPFSGRTGSLKIHVGDTVKLGDTELVQLDRLNPINVGFSVPEQGLKSVRTLAKARRFPVAVETRETPPTIRLGGQLSKSLYQFTLQSPDLPALYQSTDTMLEKIKKLDGLQDVTTDLQMTSPQLTVDIDRNKASSLGITAEQIELALSNAYGTRQVSTIYAANNDYQVILELLPEYQQSLEDLSTIYVRSANGSLVPMNALVTIKRSVGPLSVSYLGQFPSTTISFNLRPGVSLGQKVSDIEKMARETLPSAVRSSFQGSAQEFQSSLTGMGFLLIIAVLVIYLVLGILYESFIHPITILSGLPPAGLGALLTLYLFHRDLDIYGFWV